MLKCCVVVADGSSRYTPGCDCLAHRFGNAAERAEGYCQRQMIDQCHVVKGELAVSGHQGM